MSQLTAKSPMSQLRGSSGMGLPLVSSLGHCTCMRNLGDHCHEAMRRFRCMNLSGQNGMEGSITAVDCKRGVIILFDDGAVQCNSRKYAFRPGVGKDLGVQLPVCAGRCVAANRASRSRRVPTNSEFARKKM